MIIANGKIRPDWLCAHVQPRDCPACNTGVIRDPNALKCKQCLQLDADAKKAEEISASLGRANRRAGK